MNLGLLKTNRRLLIYGVLFGIALITPLISSFKPVYASTGINQQINFQGRLLNSAGATVPDGYYNIEFKIYQDGDGQSTNDSTGSPSGSLKWTEDYLNYNSQGVKVVNGYLSVALGSINPFGGSINWNQSTLWLSMNIGSTSTICTTFSGCSPDGEMTPMQSLTSAVYSLNSNELGGLTASSFGQLTSGQTWTGLNIFQNSSTGFELENGSGAVYASGNSASNQLLLGTASSLTGQLAFATISGGTLAINPTNSASNYTITLPAETGTVCTTAATGVCSTAGSGYVRLASAVVQVDSTTNNSIFINKTNSAGNILELQKSGSDVFAVNNAGNITATGIVTLGAPGSLAGTLAIGNASNSNIVTLNTGVTAVNYTLSLPTTAPTTGLCLESGGSTASQLVFNACSANPTISYVTGSETSANASGSSTTSMNVTTYNVGDVLIFATQIPTANITVSNINFSGVTTWIKIVSNPVSTAHRTEMWMGTVTSLVTAQALTVTYSGGTGNNNELVTSEYTAVGVSSHTTWGVDTSGNTSGSAATIAYPALTSGVSAENYVGYSYAAGTATTGGCYTGFTCTVTTQGNGITYNTATGATTTYPATQTQGSVTTYNAVAGILTVFVNSISINNSTSVQEGNFNVQAATSGTVAGVLEAANSGTADVLDLLNSAGTAVVSFGNTGAATFESSTASATAFQVENTSANSVLGVNTITGVTTLGTPGTLAGSLALSNSSNSNIITINTGATAANYTLSLPTTAPTTGLCLESGGSTASQLVFNACSANPTISYVTGSETSANNTGSSTTSMNVTTYNIGDVLIFATQIPTANITVSSISFSGVSTWIKIVSNPVATTHRTEMWLGTVTSLVTAQALTVTYSGGTGNNNELVTSEYTAVGVSANTTWGVDTSGSGSGSSATIAYPTIVSGVSAENYVGYAYAAGTATTGGCYTGFTCMVTAQGNGLTYNTATAAATSYRATQTQGSATTYNAVAGILTVFVNSVSINNSTSVQEANFNVQATSGTVAGVLKAASGGTSDILDLQNNSGIAVASFGNTGAATFEDSATSATAFQVENTSAISLLDVNTTNSIVQIGSSTANSNGIILALNNYNGGSQPTEIDGGIYYDNASAQFLCGEGGYWVSCGSPSANHSYSLYDEFLNGASGSLANGAYGIGSLNWYNTVIGAPGTLTYNYNTTGGNSPAASADRPGLIDIEQTGVANNSGQTMSLGTGVMLLGTSKITLQTSVNVTGANLTVLWGLDNETSAVTAPTTGIYWKEAGNGTWQYCYDNATPAEICANSSVTATAGAWSRLEIDIVSASEVDYYINGTKIAVTGITYNTTNSVSPAYASYKSTGTPGTLDLYIDYFDLRGITSAAR